MRAIVVLAVILTSWQALEIALFGQPTFEIRMEVKYDA